MSIAEAVAFLERLETDERLAAELESVKDSPGALFEKVRAAGFDTGPEEIQEAFSDRYGIELAAAQLDQIAAGADGTGTSLWDDVVASSGMSSSECAAVIAAAAV